MSGGFGPISLPLFQGSRGWLDSLSDSFVIDRSLIVLRPPTAAFGTAAGCVQSASTGHSDKKMLVLERRVTPTAEDVLLRCASKPYGKSLAKAVNGWRSPS